MWRIARVYPDADLELRRQMRLRDVKPLFIHAPYLINLASPTAATRDLSRKTVGLRRIGLIHANDSRDPRGSRRDRHWHIGQGFIGRKGFKAIVSHPRFQRIPVICETPGQVRDDRRNIAILKRLRPK